MKDQMEFEKLVAGIAKHHGYETEWFSRLIIEASKMTPYSAERFAVRVSNALEDGYVLPGNQTAETLEEWLSLCDIRRKINHEEHALRDLWDALPLWQKIKADILGFVDRMSEWASRVTRAAKPNRVLTTEKLIALRDGTPVWVETRWCSKVAEGWCTKAVMKGRHVLFDRWDEVDDLENLSEPWDRDYPWSEAGCRAWVRKPTETEMAETEWPEPEEQ